MKRNPLTDLDHDKQAFREAAREGRQTAAAAAGSDAAERLARHINACVADWPAGVISGYLPIADEMSPLPAMAGLARNGWTLALPVVAGNGRPLVFRQWRDGDALEPGPLRTRHPLPSAVEVRPDVLLVPLLAFDATGQRIGWGGGFYDRTIAALRADKDILALGIGYGGQQVDKVPAGPHDAPLDAVVSEAGILKFKDF
ncbi:MAG: 5-formyltetrahydrofolate cyclo-ligase [Rhodospirillaceae bacterium]|nr:5-formyltetrahydrofolate cyclo-ligase [Rhodospirillaceae bacterium]